MMDKTSIIEIPSDIVTEIRNMVEYLKTNNIFKYERREFLEECSPEILKVLSAARQRYWHQKTSEAGVLMKTTSALKINQNKSED
jgi:hypothetical protein